MLAYEAARGPQPELHEASIADDDSLQTLEFRDAERMIASLGELRSE